MRADSIVCVEQYGRAWASSLLVQATRTFGPSAADVAELRAAGVNATRIATLYPLDEVALGRAVRALLTDEALALKIHAQGNTFDAYTHVTKRLRAPDGAMRLGEWHASLLEKGLPVVATNTIWKLTVIFATLEHLAQAADWSELRQDAPLMASLPRFEEHIAQVLALVPNP